MGETLRIEAAPLTGDDIALLRRCSRSKTLALIACLFIFLLLVSMTLLVAVLAVSEWRSLRGADGVMLLLVVVGAGVGMAFFGRRLLRVPRAWRSVAGARSRGARPSRSCRAA